MADLKQLLLHAILPIITEQPPLLRQHPAFAVADDYDPDYIAFMQASELTRQQRSEPRERAYPEQGGERISETWLQSLSDRDCRWRFR
jgi:hypothetical protein